MNAARYALARQRAGNGGGEDVRHELHRLRQTGRPGDDPDPDRCGRIRKVHPAEPLLLGDIAEARQ